MADNVIANPTETDNPMERIRTLADAVQIHARDTTHLIRAIDDAVEELAALYCDAQAEPLDRIMTFCRLATASAREAGKQGEAIEVATIRGGGA